MEAYLIVKPFLVSLAIAGSFGFFFLRLGKLIKIMVTVSGSKQIPFDSIYKRIRVFFKEVIFVPDKDHGYFHFNKLNHQFFVCLKDYSAINLTCTYCFGKICEISVFVLYCIGCVCLT